MQSRPSADEVRRLTEHLHRLELETQKFLDGAVHDFRAVQRGLAVSLELLLGTLSSPLGPDAEEAVRQMQASVAKLNAILTGASSYAMCAAATQYSFRPVAMETALDMALASLGAAIHETGAVVEHGELPKVRGDASRLAELFHHLIDNSLKFRSAASPQIEIRVAQDSQEWLFSVRDNGIGIDQRYWEGLFLPFRRLHGSEIPGVGLGLATCKKIVETHGGHIRLESMVGRGTSFIFTLPAWMGE